MLPNLFLGQKSTKPLKKNVVVQPKRLRLPGFIPQFICTVDQEYPTMGGPKVCNVATVVDRLELNFFYPFYMNDPLFPKEIRT